MTWVIHSHCVTDVTGNSEDELVESALDHARSTHAPTMTKDQVRALGRVR